MPRPLSLWNRKTIQYTKGIPSRYFFVVTHLECGPTLQGYTVQKETTSHLVFPLRGGKQHFIKSLSGKTITIQDRGGIPPNREPLIFAGTQHGLSLQDYNIKKTTTFIFFHVCMVVCKSSWKHLLERPAFLKVQTAGTIESMKQKILDKEGTPGCIAYLLFLISSFLCLILWEFIGLFF